MAKEIVELDDKSFESATAHGDWVIDFWAEWCGPCRMMAPHFEAAAKEMKSKVNFGKVNIDDNYELAQKFEVMSIPSMILLKNGKEIDRTVGALHKSAIIEQIDKTFE